MARLRLRFRGNSRHSLRKLLAHPPPPPYPAAFGPFIAYDPSTPSVVTSSVAQSPGLTWFAPFLVYTLIFTWLKVSRPQPSQLSILLIVPQNRRSRQRIYAPKPTDATGSGMSFSGLEQEGPSAHSHDSHTDFPTASTVSLSVDVSWAPLKSINILPDPFR